MKKTNNNLATKRKKPINWWAVSFIFVAVSIPLINWLVTYVYVNLNSFVMAFQHYDSDGNLEWGFTNFKLLIDEFSKETSTIPLALKNTAISFAISFCMNICGFLVSFFLYKKILFHRGFKILFFLPSLIAGTVTASVFGQIVGIEGPIAPLVQKMLNLDYLPDLLHNSLTANATIFANTIVFSFASNMIIWGGTFSRIPDSVIEAGKLDGLNWWKEIIHITIPLVWPMFALQMILTICGFFGASGNVFLLTRGEYGTMTLSAWMYLQVLDKGNDLNALSYMSAVGLVMTVIAITVSLLVRRWTDKASWAKVQF